MSIKSFNTALISFNNSVFPFCTAIPYLSVNNSFSNILKSGFLLIISSAGNESSTIASTLSAFKSSTANKYFLCCTSSISGFSSLKTKSATVPS